MKTHYVVINIIYIIKWCLTATSRVNYIATHNRLMVNKTFPFKENSALYAIPLTAGPTHSSATDVSFQLCFPHVLQNMCPARSVAMAPRPRRRFLCQSTFSSRSQCARAFSRGSAELTESGRVSALHTSSCKPGRAQRYHGLLHPADTSPAGPFYFRDQLQQSVRA